MQKATKLFATFSLPGTFFAEDSTIPVRSSNVTMLTKIPANAYAVKFWERDDIIDDDGQVFKGKARDLHSHCIFLGGRLFTPEEILAMPGDNQILHDNIAFNGYSHGIKCRMGNWQGFKEGVDVIYAEDVLDFCKQ